MTCFADLPLVLQEQNNHNDQVKLLDAKEALIEQEDFGQNVYLLECDALAKLPFSDCESAFQQINSDPVSLTSLINALVRLREDCIKDEVAKDGCNSADYVDHLAALALQHRAVRHPYLRGMAAGTLPSPYAALQDFARHYYGYSAHFPRYLTALISKLENPVHRAALLENLTEESGQYEEEELMQLMEYDIQPEWIVGIPHPTLFERFRKSIGVDNAAMLDDHIEVVCWREQFLAIMNTGSAAEALGALGLGTETIVQTIYQPFGEAIQKVGTIKPKDAVFFPLHTAVDDQHQATLKAIATDFAATTAGRTDLAKGMFKALALRDSFWSWLYARAQGENVT
jgi:pyrroloquinoline quinone (PQQ) biosynthesis protein C